MASLIVTLLAAFEFTVCDPATAGMAATAASGGWRSGFGNNPALLSYGLGPAVAAAFTKPFCLENLYSGRIEAMARSKKTSMAVGCCIVSNCLPGYQEHDLALAMAFYASPIVSIGASVHGMCQVSQWQLFDLLAAVDVGVALRLGAVRLGFAGRRLNSPRLHDESELPVLLKIGWAWQPVSELLLGLDICREGVQESAALGAELRLVQQVRLRAGFVTSPLRYSGGIDIDIGSFGTGYAWQFHPQLKDTHVVGVETRWH